MWGRGPCKVWRIHFFFFSILFVTACLHESNHPPTANAGSDVIMPIASTITLDGSQSNDVDNDSLSFQWELIKKPSTSKSTLTNKNTSSPQLFLDVAGQYTIKLVVSDGKIISKADHITITTTNDRPTAKISLINSVGNSAYKSGDTISFSAGDSFDPEDQSLSYAWSLIVKPSGSNAFLNNFIHRENSFAVDLMGVYILHLIVTDGVNLSEPETIVFEVLPQDNNLLPSPLPANDIPVASIIEMNSSIGGFYTINDVIALSAQQSFDPENKKLTFNWSLLIKPKNSFTEILDRTAMNIIFSVDVAGKYVLSLVVSDGIMFSAPQVVELLVGDTATSPKPMINPHLEQTPVVEPCIECHNNQVGKASWRPLLHIFATNNCDACHDVDSFKNARTNHSELPGQCVSCHNSSLAIGKPNDHLKSSDVCSACHNINNFGESAKVNHTQITSPCSYCHNNYKAGGLSSSHIETTKLCEACHSSLDWIPAITFDHNEISGSCVVCHNYTIANGKSENHISTTDSCVSCHSKDSFAPLLKMDHDQTNIECADCHLRRYPSSSILPALHQTRPGDNGGCESCHPGQATTTTLPVNHPCTACHGESPGSKSFKLETHPITSNTCNEAGCHDSISWKIKNLVNPHENTTEPCIACHNGTDASGISQPTWPFFEGTHIPTTNECGACHIESAWIPVVVLDMNEVLGACVDCHNGSISSGGPNDLIHTSDTCQACHTVMTWIPAIYIDHTVMQGECIDCHDNTTARGSPLDNTNVGDDCKRCHNTDAYIPVLEGSHTSYLQACEECHDGTIATGKLINHLVAPEQCILCHETTSFKIFERERIKHSMIDFLPCEICHAPTASHNTYSVVDQCMSCHIVASWEYPARSLDQK